jgi:hypothetical protein
VEHFGVLERRTDIGLTESIALVNEVRPEQELPVEARETPKEKIKGLAMGPQKRR